MKSSIKVFAAILFFFAVCTAVNAQRGGGQPPSPEDMAARQTDQMTKKLNLDEAQTAKVKEINLTYAKKMLETRENNRGDRQAMREAITPIQEEKNAELKTILTEEQYKSYEEMLAKRGGRRGGQGKRGSRR